MIYHIDFETILYTFVVNAQQETWFKVIRNYQKQLLAKMTSCLQTIQGEREGKEQKDKEKET